jgi:sulfur carrier protein ThiS adenylyltransferase
MSVNLYISEEERAIFEKVTIGIAGAGGLGSNCAMHLVRAGFKNLVIADYDNVSPSNLNRQFFFADQIGKQKIQALKENLLRIESRLNLTLHNIKLTGENLATVFKDCDVVAEAFDTAEAKEMFLTALIPTSKKLVSVSGIAGWGRSNSIKVRSVGKNLILIGDCNTSENKDAGIFPESPRVGIAAAMQANSIIALFLGSEI